MEHAQIEGEHEKDEEVESGPQVKGIYGHGGGVSIWLGGLGSDASSGGELAIEAENSPNRLAQGTP
jgi:hypothetical protein